MPKGSQLCRDLQHLDDESCKSSSGRNDGEKLARALELTPFARTEFNDGIIRRKTRWNHAGEQSSGRSWALEVTEFIRVIALLPFKFNRSGTTPAHDWKNFPPHFRSISSDFKVS